MRIVSLLVAPVLFLTAPATAVPNDSALAWCGAHPADLLIDQARHELLSRRREKAARPPLRSAPAVLQRGQIAVFEDDGTILAPPNPFDLKTQGIQFLRRPRGMGVVRTHLGFREPLGLRLELGDDDSVRVEFPGSFRFPFGERIYRSLFVNSNGNLTFGEADPSPFTGLEFLVDGPPRVAALFADLDPSAPVADGSGVYLRFLPGRVRVTWFKVGESGGSRPNTVQVTLFETGRVTVVFGDEVEALQPVVVGVRPAVENETRLVDFDAELPVPPRRGVIAEEFVKEPRRDDIAIARTFFQNFQDVYDHLIVFLDFDEGTETLRATGTPIKNDVMGIGLPIFDLTALVGSAGRLEGYVQMGSLGLYPDDPDERFAGTFSTVGVLAHEVAHRYLAYVRFLDRGGTVSDRLLGRDFAHWSFHLHTGGSLLEGNDLIDNGDGSFTTTDRASSRFSELDQYLMGMIPPSEVPDFFYVSHPSAGRPSSPPAVGATFFGDRVDLSVADVIAAEGPRRPASASEPRTFRMAFIVVGAPGKTVSFETIDKVDRFRRRFMTFLPEATSGNARVRTGLFPR